MAHLGWFFAGTSIGLFVGVLITSLAKMADMAEEQNLFEAKETARGKPNVFRIRS